MTQRAEVTPPLQSSQVIQSTLIGSFSRSQVAAAAATVADYGLLFTLVELCHVWYVFATAAGALAGAVTNFVLNRHWSFRASEGKWGAQAWRYTVVSGTSLALNTGGVYGFTEYLGFRYYFSVLIVSFLVGVFFNFPLHRYFVFR